VGVIVFLAIALKWAPAKLTTRIFRYRAEEGRLIFGLSVAQAASTLAAALVGYKIGLVDDNVLNGIIMMILATCMVSSFVVESSAKKLAVLETQKNPELPEAAERILVPIANPNSVGPLLDLAIMISPQKSMEPIYALSVINDDESAQEQILNMKKALEKVVKEAAATDTVLEPIARVDLNIGGGIVRAIKELMATKIIIGWHGRYNPKDYLFGTVLDYLLGNTGKTIMVTRLIYPLNVVKKIVVVAPKNAELENGFPTWVETLKILANQTCGALHFFGPEKTLKAIAELASQTKPTVDIHTKPFEDWDDFLILGREVSDSDLFVVIDAREGSVSHHPWLNKVPRYISKHFSKINFIVLYPEQKINASYELS
jgi:hypothetical protein